MADWAPKRFWKNAAATQTADGWQITLDTRVVKTPAKAPLIVPTSAMAQAIAAEWDAQGEKVDPATMPNTRSANAAIDKVTPQFDEVAALVAEYGGSDLICYRAAHPDGLVAAQVTAWDPLLDFAAQTLNAPLLTTVGVMPLAQSPATLAVLGTQVRALTPFELTAFSDLVALSGSLVIGFAAAHGFAPIDGLWDASRVDERWQISQWGDDDDALAATEIKRSDFRHAEKFFRMAREQVLDGK